MNEIMAITHREFFIRIYRRSFFIGSLIAPLFFILWIVLPTFLMSSNIVERRIEVLDQSGDPALFQTIEEKVRTINLGTRFLLSHTVVSPHENLDDLKSEKVPELLQNSNTAVILLRPGVLDDVRPEYYANNLGDMSIVGLSQTVGVAITTRRLVKLGLDPVQIQERSNEVDLRMIKVTPEGETQAKQRDFALPIMLFFLMSVTVFGYGQRVMMEMIEEKQSKVIEVVISSVKPFQLMVGKLLGIGLVGLLQLCIWVFTVFIVMLFSKNLITRSPIDLSGFPATLLISFFVYFILGYFMFGTIYAIVGAMISRSEDIAMFQRPLTILNLVPLFTVWLVMRDPNSSLAVVLSIVPFFSPTLMMLRISLITPPLWEIVLSILLMILTTFVAVWLAAKVYRVGILLYGKKPTLAQIGRWFRYA